MAGFDDRLRTTVAGLEFPSPVGAAAGLDKEFRFLGSLLNLGFGFVSGGTVTLNPRPGNPRPRLLRKVEHKALVNAMGFPGPGLDVISHRIASSRVRSQLFVSISGTLEDEVVQCHRSLEPNCAAVEINISSPNTSGLRAFHDPGRLRVLVQAVASEMKRPLFVKLPPWERSRQSRENGISLAETAIDAGANGVIIANTRPVEHGRTKGRPRRDERRSAVRRYPAHDCGGAGKFGETGHDHRLRRHRRRPAGLALVGRWSRSRTTLYGPRIRRSRPAGVDQPQSGSPDGASGVQVCRGNQGPSAGLERESRVYAPPAYRRLPVS